MPVFHIRNFAESMVSIAIPGIRKVRRPEQSVEKGKIVNKINTYEVPAESGTLVIEPSYIKSDPPTVGEVYVSEEAYEILRTNPQFKNLIDPKLSKGSVMGKPLLEVRELGTLPEGAELTILEMM